jgi:predicted DNA-binding transcriptional regulator AlpA
MPPRKRAISSFEAVNPAEDRLIGINEVLRRVPVHRSTLHKMIKTKTFPQPINIMRSKLFWRLSTFLAWLEEREQVPIERRDFADTLHRKRRRTKAR